MLPRNMMYPALLPLMCTPRLPVVDWTDTPANVNELVRFTERRNLVSARVPSHFKRSLQTYTISVSSFASLQSHIVRYKFRNIFIPCISPVLRSLLFSTSRTICFLKCLHHIPHYTLLLHFPTCIYVTVVCITCAVTDCSMVILTWINSLSPYIKIWIWDLCLHFHSHMLLKFYILLYPFLVECTKLQTTGSSAYCGVPVCSKLPHLFFVCVCFLLWTVLLTFMMGSCSQHVAE